MYSVIKCIILFEKELVYKKSIKKTRGNVVSRTFLNGSDEREEGKTLGSN